jgi:catechol 2,3-dioxygenase-like lactoylglutathione lyase family enzyme
MVLRSGAASRMSSGDAARTSTRTKGSSSMNSSPFATSYIHHVALTVPDAGEYKNWLASMLGFRVQREFPFNGMQFVWMSPEGSDSPIIEVIGGGSRDESQEGSPLARRGLHHVCLHVHNVDDVMAKLKQHNVTVLVEMPVGPPGSGVKRASFISDPWGNVFEFAELEVDA